MRHLFTESGKKLLESLCFTNTLFAFDYDGTLAKIVPTPANAYLESDTLRLIQLLNERVPVAIISGRSVRDLAPRLHFKPRFLIGNHGLEGLANFSVSEEFTEQTCSNWKCQLMSSILGDPAQHQLELEDKRLSLALHYRKSRNKQAAKLAIFQSIMALSPSPRVIPGKCVVNLVPPGGPHKGIALLEAMLQANVKSAFYIGDDDTDEDVFSLPDARVMTVRVGRKRSSNAQFYIRRQWEINRLLKSLLGYLGPKENAATSRNVIYEEKRVRNV